MLKCFENQSFRRDVSLFSIFRYCYLRQEVDGTYILEMHKDEKQCEAKTTIVMDFCTEVVQVSALPPRQFPKNKQQVEEKTIDLCFHFRIQNVGVFVLSCE